MINEEINIFETARKINKIIENEIYLSNTKDDKKIIHMHGNLIIMMIHKFYGIARNSFTKEELLKEIYGRALNIEYFENLYLSTKANKEKFKNEKIKKYRSSQ